MLRKTIKIFDFSLTQRYISYMDKQQLEKMMQEILEVEIRLRNKLLAKHLGGK